MQQYNFLYEVSKKRTWDTEKRVRLSNHLRTLINDGGVVLGAFEDKSLIGFASIDGAIKGQTANYANLSMLFVDDKHKRRGIGSSLLKCAFQEAKTLGTNKIFISAIAAEDTIAFYLFFDAALANEIIEDFVDTDEDIFLEILL